MILSVSRTPFSSFVSNATGCLAWSDVSGATIQTPNFNSFVDLNGDCRSDLFIMTTQNGKNYFEIWIRQSDSPTFCLIENTHVTSNVASLAFADINGDSGLDLVYIQQDSTPTVHIIYNQFKNAAGTACQGFNASSSLLPFLNSTDEDRKNVYDASSNNTVRLALSGSRINIVTGNFRIRFEQRRRHPSNRETLLI